MLVRAFQEQGAGLRVLDLVDEGVVLLAQIDLVEQPGVAEAVRLEVVEAVHRGAAARQGDALHVPALGPSTRPDALLGEHVQGEGVDALLVYDDERLALLAHAALELDDLLHLVVRELALALDEPLALLRVRVVEARGDLGLFVLERDVAREDVAVGEALGHVGVPRRVVEHQASHEPGVGPELVLHGHHLDHVQVDGQTPLVVFVAHRQYGVHDGPGHEVRDLRLELRPERGPRDALEELPRRVLRVHADGARVEDFERLVPREVVALGDDARVHALADVSFRALQKFARQQHHGRRAVARDFVLRGGGARDHGRRRVHDLHLLQEDGAVLRELDLARAAHEHLQRSSRPEVRLEDRREPSAGGDVD
mmetsp:Transcript_6999/g.17932  ORF Transcript_6999/g.17932 Transcript_6999/m.17932 type:complete len:368 (-) Transcript_6999:190-1293(-)